MAQNIVGALGELGFREIGVQKRPGLVVLRKTKMPALLIETGFINSEKDNTLYDEKKQDIPQAIADAILGTLDETDAENPLYYRVQTGAFRNRENADRLLYQLLDRGYPAYILWDGDLFKVQVGAYQQLGNAILIFYADQAGAAILKYKYRAWRHLSPDTAAAVFLFFPTKCTGAHTKGYIHQRKDDGLSYLNRLTDHRF